MIVLEKGGCWFSQMFWLDFDYWVEKLLPSTVLIGELELNEAF